MMLRDEGRMAYVDGLWDNPYPSGTRKAKAWDRGFLGEHKYKSRAPELPDWIDIAQWNLSSPTSRLYGIQNVIAMIGGQADSTGTVHYSGGDGLAALRGIPDKPPTWLVKSAWDRGANSRYEEAQRLMRYCFLDQQVGIRAMYDRDEARKNCKHDFIPVTYKGEAVGGRVCAICGTLDTALE